MPIGKPVIVIPVDARPVCYDAVKTLAGIAGLKCLLPPKELLGHLKQPAAMAELIHWWGITTAQYPYATTITALDTLSYGGLIPSRSHTLTTEQLQDRVSRFLGCLLPSHRPRYAISSIMRIPNYNLSEEEPDYWQTWGKQLYAFSTACHQQAIAPTERKAYGLEQGLPEAVIDDFMDRRTLNFTHNESTLNLLEAGVLDYLILGQDDTGPFGLNVEEAEQLQAHISSLHLDDRCRVQTGTDEAVQLLLAKALWANEPHPPNIRVLYSPDSAPQTMARFDGCQLGEVVTRHMHTLGAVTATDTTENTPIALVVHGPATGHAMGDHLAHVTGEQTEGPPATTNQEAQATLHLLENTLETHPHTVLVDAAYANGGDPALLAHFFPETDIANATSSWPALGKLAGYSAWNTPGNRIGSALAMAATVHWAQLNDTYNRQAHQHGMLTHLLDDGLYQGRLRKQQATGIAEALNRPATAAPHPVLVQAFNDGLAQLAKSFDLSDPPRITPSFPCQRSFEIQLAFEPPLTQHISSVSNDTVKQVVQLHQKKYRQTYQLVLVEGQHPVAEAFGAGLYCKGLFVREGTPDACSMAGTAVPMIGLTGVTEAVMAKLSTTTSPAPCMGVFERPPTLTLDTIIRNRLGPVVVLVDIQDPGNMGTIIRSACAFGAAALMTVGNCTDPFSPKVIRASAGQVFRLPLIE
ncbi:MAG: DUF4127 family protein, partial [Cyanobacteria bacterium HKST-UBA03]|nr:DUF4127 family protein [Cyanobacteria bacterium HKST-UBA03]